MSKDIKETLEDDKEISRDIMQILGALIYIPLVLVVFVGVPLVVQGLAIAKMWAWFILPTFNIAVPPVSVVIALMLVCGYLINRGKKIDTKASLKVAFKEFAISITAPLLLLLMGWILIKYGAHLDSLSQYIL